MQLKTAAKRGRVKGAEACRAQWAKQAGGALEIARSDACGATMRVSRTRAPCGVWGIAPSSSSRSDQRKSSQGAKRYLTVTHLAAAHDPQNPFAPRPPFLSHPSPQTMRRSPVPERLPEHRFPENRTPHFPRPSGSIFARMDAILSNSLRFDLFFPSLCTFISGAFSHPML